MNFRNPNKRGAAASLVGGGYAAGSAAFRSAYATKSEALSELFVREMDARRPFLFLVPCAFFGVLLYFAANDEPWILAPIIAMPSVVLLMVYALQRPTRRLFMIGLCCLFVLGGFSAARFRTLRIDTPIIKEVTIAPLEGIVQSLDQRTDNARLLIKPIRIKNSTDDLPFYVRVTVSGTPAFEAGARIRAYARLLPPPEPVRPGGYDFARDAYFAKIGAVGSILGPVTTLSINDSVSTRFDLLASVDRMRNALTKRIASVIGGQAGAVSAALITGKRGTISDETNQILRAAGIYHVVSISGLHMVLVAGMVFFFVRLFLLVIPGLALRYPIKIWAAIAAMAAACIYDVFAGSEVATERSLLMTLALFGAIVVGRPALAMRNLALSAFIILCLEPETLLGPSFQMSFAAVGALIAAFERIPSDAMRRISERNDNAKQSSRLQRSSIERLVSFLFRHIRLVVVTTCLAEAATAPFSLYHFQTFQPLGLIGNMVTIPLVEMIAMPVGIIGLITLPFGLDAPLWHFMGLSVQAMLSLSNYVAQFPYAILHYHASDPLDLILVAAGMLWLMVWSTGIRWLGCAPIIIGAILSTQNVKPDLLIARDGQLVATRGTDGAIHVMGRGLNAFTVEQWLAADGDTRKADDPSLRKGPLCSSSGCITKTINGETVILGLAQSELVADCRLAQILITPDQAPDQCAAHTVIDRNRSAEQGAIAVYRIDNETRLVGARDPTRHRPWERSRTLQNDETLATSDSEKREEPITPR